MATIAAHGSLLLPARRTYSGVTRMLPSAATTSADRSPETVHHELGVARRLAERDPRGLEELHALTSRACFGVILGIVRDRGHAEDVQQQVYAELWRRAGQFDPARGSLMTWVLTIARSRAVDHLRKRREQPIDQDAVVALGGAGDDRAYDDLLDRAVIAEALQLLPPRERELLRLRFWDGFSQAEIAERTGVPLGTVKSRMTAGLARLREDLSRHEVGR